MSNVEERYYNSDKYASLFADKISALCSTKLELDANLLSMWSASLVYMALGEDAVLYVGMSTQGLSRVFDRNHHILSNIHSSIKSIMLFVAKDERAARRLETLLIKEFHPTHNTRGIEGKRKHRVAA